MRDWKALARARDLAIPAADLDHVTAPLEALEETFRPLVQDLKPGMEPCTEFRPADEDAE